MIRFLDREAEITTRYGGGFVQSIDGISGELADGRSLDWFFYVNGIESPRGGAEVPVRGGDRIWWDYRDWTAAISTPAVVGSFPEPFVQAAADEADREPVRVECRGARARLRSRRASASTGPGSRSVGRGRRRRPGAAAAGRALARGPRRPARGAARRRPGDQRRLRAVRARRRRWTLTALDRAGATEPHARAPARASSRGCGAATSPRPGSSPAPTPPAPSAPRALLDADALAQRYAVATDGAEIPLPDGEAG